MIVSFRSVFLLLFLSGNFQVFAQTKQKESFQNKYKWDLSLNIYELFKSGEASMLLRYAPDKDKGAIRFMFGLQTSNSDHEAVMKDSSRILEYFLTQEFTSYSIRAGYEFHKNSGRFQLFYGPELGFNYEKTVLEYQPGFDLSQFSSPIIAARYNAGVFAGVKYFILRRLSISSESLLQYRFLNSRVYYSDDPGVLATRIKSYAFQFFPLNALNVSFHF